MPIREMCAKEAKANIVPWYLGRKYERGKNYIK
jgi:hypothetical protein